jgi:hypothetical protein
MLANARFEERDQERKLISIWGRAQDWRSYISAPPYVFMAWYLIKNGKNITLYMYFNY